jgi:hypothetical protein
MTLTPRNTAPRNIVATSHMTWVKGGRPVCAARTASAIVSELKISTAVLKAPQPIARCALASWKAAGEAAR